MKKPYHYKFIPIDESKIIKHVYLDKDTIVTCYVVKETETKYICYNMHGGTTYGVKKINAYETKEEVQYIRWARLLNRKSNKEIKKFLLKTKMTDYKKRYMNEYPEKLI